MHDDESPQSITEHEVELGYMLAYVENPDREFAYHPSIHLRVIHPLDSGLDRVEKVINPDGAVEYSHQAFGRHGTSSESQADWNPVSVPIPNPDLALRAARSGRAESMNPPGFRIRRGGEPTLSLRCSACSHRFKMSATHLPKDDKVICPECKVSACGEAFIDLDSDTE